MAQHRTHCRVCKLRCETLLAGHEAQLRRPRSLGDGTARNRRSAPAAVPPLRLSGVWLSRLRPKADHLLLLPSVGASADEKKVPAALWRRLSSSKEEGSADHLEVMPSWRCAPHSGPQRAAGFGKPCNSAAAARRTWLGMAVMQALLSRALSAPTPPRGSTLGSMACLTDGLRPRLCHFGVGQAALHRLGASLAHPMCGQSCEQQYWTSTGREGIYCLFLDCSQRPVGQCPERARSLQEHAPSRHSLHVGQTSHLRGGGGP